MCYSDVQPIALAILTSIITGGFVLVFVEIGNRKNREDDKHDQVMAPFMHKLSAFFRYISWSSSHIRYTKPLEGYEKKFKELIDEIGGYGDKAITSGGDYSIDFFSAEKLDNIAFDINNIWYYYDKMHPCRLTWDSRMRPDSFILKELKEINPIYLKEIVNVELVAKVSGEFYTDVYQPIENETYRHEAYQKHYKRQAAIVVAFVCFVLLLLSFMLFIKLPIWLLQLGTLLVIMMLISSLLMLAVGIRTQIGLWNESAEYIKKHKSLKVNMIKGSDWVKKSVSKALDFIVPKLLIIGLAFSVWAILSIEITWIPKISTCMSESVAEGWNKMFLALAYSYIAGAIIYFLTVKLPYWRNKQRLMPVINAKIRNIGIHLSNMNLEFRDPNNNPLISDVNAVMALFKTEKWKEKCKMPEHVNCRNVTEGYVRDYKGLQYMVGQLINDYKNYLTSNQLIMLEQLRDGWVNQFLSTAEESEYKYQFTDYFYDKVLQPSYRRLLEVYNQLHNEYE